MDVQVENHGSLFLVEACSDLADQWIAENVSDDALFFGSRLVVEPRYIEALVQGMLEAGLDVRS